MKKIKAMVLALVFFSIPASAQPKTIGYLSLWSLKEGFKIEDLHPELLTHLIFSFLDISPTGECKILTEKPGDQEFTEKAFAQLNQLKKKNTSLKILASIGGYGNSTLFSDVALDSASRQKFVGSCLKLLNQFSLDGLDIDWEYPVRGGEAKNHRRPADGKHYTALLTEFKKQMPKGKSLSIAVPTNLENLRDLELAKVAKNLDWVGLMAYDECEAGSAVTCHHASLEPSAKKAIHWLTHHGVKSGKVVLGVPFYGYHWKLKTIKHQGIGQKIEHRSEVNAENRLMTYREISEKYFSKENEHWDQHFQAPWLWNAKDQSMITYENEKSLGIKTKYVKRNHLGGILIWELSQDTPAHTLLNSIHEGFKK